MKLEWIDAVIPPRKQLLPGLRIGPAAVEQLAAGVAGASHKARGVRAERQIQAHWTNGGTIANAESDRVHHVIEPEYVLRRCALVSRRHLLGRVRLVVTERDIPQPAVHVAGIPKKDSAHIIANERKAQLRVEKQQSLPAHRETG